MNRNVALWVGFLGGPIIWLMSFEARFALAPWACTFQNKWALHGVAIAAVILCLASALVSFREWRSISAHQPTPKTGPIASSNFLAILGIVTGCGTAMIVIAQSIPDFMLGACQ